MFVKRCLAFFVVMVSLVSLVVNRSTTGAELKDFKKSMGEFKDIMETNNSIKSSEVKKIEQKIQNAKTDNEITNAYAEYTDAFAKMIVNDKRAEESLNKALSNLQDAPKWFQKGGDVNDALGNTFKTSAADITSLYQDMENAISGLASSDLTSPVSDGKDKELMTETKKFFQELYAGFKEQNKELFSKLEIVKNKGVNTNSVDTAIGDIKRTLGYYKNVLAFTRSVHLVEFKKAAAVGKVRCLQERLADLMDGVFQGLPVEDYFEGIHSDQYDTAYINYIMVKDLENSRFSTMGTHKISEKVMKKLSSLRKVPKPGSVNDGNPNHKYFLDKDKDRWYWIDTTCQGNVRESPKTYAPFDYEAGTGKYILFKNGRCYSTAPIYNGAEVEIFPDEELKKKGSAEEPKKG